MIKFRNQIVLLLPIAILLSCSSKSDNEIFESANQNIKKEMYVEAISDFQELIDKYPDSQLTPKATFEIGKIYQGQMIKNITRTQSFEKAIEYYSIIVDTFPDDANAPNALFMIGFIQANELQRLENAKETYKLFMEKYPDSELASSAQAEIDNLGLSPEEILRQKMSTVQK
ncbi:tol-pal system YbgF family protein [Bacteroidota bacterium]